MSIRNFLLSLLMGAAVCTTGWAQAPAWQNLDEALAQAVREDRPVLVYVEAPWCGLCRKMEREVFPQAAPLVARFLPAKLDFSDYETALWLGAQARSPAAWARHLGAEATPSFILIQPDGTPITRVTSYLEAGAFNLLLAYAATGAYRHASFEAYTARIRQYR